MVETTSSRLRGKIAIVTGIGSGIGRGVALMFARHGATVVGCDIDAATAEQTVVLAQEEGLAFSSVHPCDMTRPEGAQCLIDETVARHGRIDILVNAAAFGAMVPIEMMEFEAHWKKTLSGELDLVFLACKAAWPHLKKNGGVILNFASANAWGVLRGSPALAHCAGKGGVLAMTRQLALEGAPHKIRANTISPGLIVTGATEPVLELPGFIENVKAGMLLDRLGRPEDIGWAAIYLASDEAEWVTGADFRIDGGVGVF